jgi:hypothetical protein
MYVRIRKLWARQHELAISNLQQFANQFYVKIIISTQYFAGTLINRTPIYVINIVQRRVETCATKMGIATKRRRHPERENRHVGNRARTVSLSLPQMKFCCENEDSLGCFAPVLV